MKREEDKPIEFEGTVTKILPSSMFRVKLDGNDLEILAHMAGKMKKNFIKLAIGDKVKIEMSPYDLTKGRIVYRMKN